MTTTGENEITKPKFTKKNDWLILIKNSKNEDIIFLSKNKLNEDNLFENLKRYLISQDKIQAEEITSFEFSTKDEENDDIILDQENFSYFHKREADMIIKILKKDGPENSVHNTIYFLVVNNSHMSISKVFSKHSYNLDDSSYYEENKLNKNEEDLIDITDTKYHLLNENKKIEISVDELNKNNNSLNNYKSQISEIINIVKTSINSKSIFNTSINEVENKDNLNKNSILKIFYQNNNEILSNNKIKINQLYDDLNKLSEELKTLKLSFNKVQDDNNEFKIENEYLKELKKTSTFSLRNAEDNYIKLSDAFKEIKNENEFLKSEIENLRKNSEIEKNKNIIFDDNQNKKYCDICENLIKENSNFIFSGENKISLFELFSKNNDIIVKEDVNNFNNKYEIKEIPVNNEIEINLSHALISKEYYFFFIPENIFKLKLTNLSNIPFKHNVSFDFNINKSNNDKYFNIYLLEFKKKDYFIEIAENSTLYLDLEFILRPENSLLNDIFQEKKNLDLKVNISMRILDKKNDINYTVKNIEDFVIKYSIQVDFLVKNAEKFFKEKKADIINKEVKIEAFTLIQFGQINWRGEETINILKKFKDGEEFFKNLELFRK